MKTTQNTHTMKNNIILTLTQGEEYTHTINVNVNGKTQITFGQLLGQLNFKFFRSVAAMRYAGNKGFSFNNPFHFAIESNGVKLCDTITLPQEQKAKVRMSNTQEGQKRFARLMVGMLYSAMGEDVQTTKFGDVLETTYTMGDEAAAIRTFLDTPISELID